MGYCGDVIDRKELIAEVKRRGGTVEDDSAGRWTVLQLVAPKGMLWGEGLRMIRVEWPDGQASSPACYDAWERIDKQTFVPIPEKDADFYAEN